MDEKIKFESGDDDNLSEQPEDLAPLSSEEELEETGPNNKEHKNIPDDRSRATFAYLKDWVNESSATYDSPRFKEGIDVVINFSDVMANIEQANETKQFQNVETDIAEAKEAAQALFKIASELREPIAKMVDEIKKRSQEAKGEATQLAASFSDRILNDAVPTFLPYNEYNNPLLYIADWEENGFEKRSLEPPSRAEGHLCTQGIYELSHLGNNAASVLYFIESFWQNMKHLTDHADEILSQGETDPDAADVAYGESAYRKSRFLEWAKRKHPTKAELLEEIKNNTQEEWEKKYNILLEKDILSL